MMTGPRTALSTCRPTIRKSESPTTFAASTYSSFRTPTTVDRTRRKYDGAMSSPKTAIAATMLGPVRAYSAMSRTIPGSDIRTSETQLALASNLPR